MKYEKSPTEFSITLSEHGSIIPILLKAWREVMYLKNSKENIVDGG